MRKNRGGFQKRFGGGGGGDDEGGGKSNWKANRDGAGGGGGGGFKKKKFTKGPKPPADPNAPRKEGEDEVENDALEDGECFCSTSYIC